MSALLKATTAIVQERLSRSPYSVGELRKCFVVGICGPPGAGKSTLAKQLAAESCLQTAHHVSLDDFYLTPEERKRAGAIWRGPPGTHDLGRLGAFVHALRAGEDVRSPVYDKARECRELDRLTHRPRVCIVEGWFVGARLPGYEGLEAVLDLLIYLDMDLADALSNRRAREAAVVAEGRGGMSDSELTAFWLECLAPGVDTWVRPVRCRADVVMRLAADHSLVDVAIQGDARNDAARF